MPHFLKVHYILNCFNLVLVLTRDLKWVYLTVFQRSRETKKFKTKLLIVSVGMKVASINALLGGACQRTSAPSPPPPPPPPQQFRFAPVGNSLLLLPNKALHLALAALQSRSVFQKPAKESTETVKKGYLFSTTRLQNSRKEFVSGNKNNAFFDLSAISITCSP